MTKRIEMVYKDAVDNLMFIKREVWRITYYATAAYVALFTAAKAIDAEFYDRLVFSGVAIAIGALSGLMLKSYADTLEKFRERLAWIYETYFSSNEQEGLGLLQPKSRFDRFGFIQALIAACIAGAVVAVLVIWLPFK
jgi:hypothetical protein